MPSSARLDNPSAEMVLRWGQALLWLGLALGLILTLAVAWRVPAYASLVPLGLAAMIGGWFLFQRPVLNLSVLLVSFLSTLSYDSGVQLQEVVYGLYYYSFVLYWYGTRLLRGERFVWTPVDRAVAFTIVFGLVVGVALGVLFGGSALMIRGEATAFTMLGLYFPVKELCRQKHYGPEIIAGVFFFVGLFIAIRNFFNFKEIILAATEAWQVADARPGLNEMHLLIPAILALVLLLHVRRWIPRLALTVAFLVLVSALVLTKSRGYWIDFAFAIAVLAVLLRGRYRWRLILAVIGGTAGLVLVALLFFGPLFDLVLSGTLNRFGTLGTAFTEDRSLVNRMIESSAIWEGIKQNPILGHGFGTTISYFDLNFLTTRTKSFMHNGYIALWFKQGLLVMLLMLFAWFGAAWQGLKLYWNEKAFRHHRLLALGASLSLIAIIPSVGTSNPFIVIDQVFAFALQLGLAAGLYQRYTHADAPSPRSNSHPSS